MPSKKEKQEYEKKFFKTSQDFRTWLLKYHDTSPGLWLQFYKKDSGVESLQYAGALDEALCFGWIDGIANKGDKPEYYFQKFVPRRPRSIWSKRNREHIARLTKEGKMEPAGIEQVEAAKKDGRWEAAYDSPANMKVPPDFEIALEKFPEAKRFYDSLNKTNTYGIAFQLNTAKRPETRERRFIKLLDKMKRQEKLH